MNKLITTIIASLFATAAFAQTPATPASAATPATPAVVKAEKSARLSTLEFCVRHFTMSKLSPKPIGVFAKL